MKEDGRGRGAAQEGTRRGPERTTRGRERTTRGREEDEVRTDGRGGEGEREDER